MRGLHTSDLHIGESYKILPNEYLNRQEKMLHEVLISLPISLEIDLLIVAGDLFHTKSPSSIERDLLLTKLLEADSNGIRTIILPGNHDRINPSLTNINSYDILFKAKKFKKVVVVDKEPTMLKHMGGHILCIPHGFPIRKTAKDLLSKVGSKSEFVCAFAHGAIEGAISNNGKALKGESLGTLKGITYFGLGDIHRFQRVSRRVFYSGAPIQHHFGDTLPKGVLIFDTDNPDNPELVPIPGIKPFVTVNEGEEIPKDCYVRLLGHRTLITEDLPENVVKVTTFAEVTDDTGKGWKAKTSVTKGLTPFLKSKGLNKKDRKLGKRIIKDIVEGR